MSNTKCSFTYVDGRGITYTNWVDGFPPKTCTIDECDNCNMCVYMDVVGGTNSNWKTGNCFDIESFGCEVDVGTHIHDIPKPDIGYHCQQPEDIRVSYRIYTDDILANIFAMPQCYSQPHKNFDARGLWQFCLDYCTNQTAIPASIHSEGQNNFVGAFLKESTWLGIDNIKKGILPQTWPYDNTKIDYTAFMKDFPQTNSVKTALFILDSNSNFGLWKNVDPTHSNNCFCQKPSISGNPEPPPYPEIPVNELCDTDWIYISSRTNCIYHDISFRAWNAAEQNCEAKGGSLVSVNSPDTVIELLRALGTYFYDPTSIGEFQINIIKLLNHNFTDI